MPELPEVEAVCRKLRRARITGLAITEAHIQRRRITSPQSPEDVEDLALHRRVEKIERRAKHILVRLSGGMTMLVHLRMTGNLIVVPDFRLRPLATSAWFALEDGRALLFEDQRGLGTLRIAERFENLEELGPEPLSRRFTPDLLIQLARNSRLPAKLFLMDQTKVAGLGNIYAAEALWTARIDPKRPVETVDRRKLLSLHAGIVRILRDALKSACIAYSRPGGFREAEGYTPAVYGREGEPCLRCGRWISRIIQGGRSTYFCSYCQH